LSTIACQVSNLRKVYKDPRVVANDGIDFTVGAGEVFGLLGPNGAGKSTLVKQLVGLIRPTAGEIRLFGELVKPGDRRSSRVIAYLPQGALALGELRVREAIAWIGMLRGLEKDRARGGAEKLMSRLTITDIEDRQLRKLSGGQRRLTQIAMTLIGRSPVLVLDEPTADIDPGLRREIWKLMVERARAGAAVILVTHDVAEAEAALDRVAIIQHGRVMAAGTPAELKAHLSHRTRIEVVIGEEATVDVKQIATLVGPNATVDGRRVSGWVPADDAIPTLEKVRAAADPRTLEDLRLVTPSLEDVYLELSGHYFEDEERN
jgi:ABC-2 type transport system ATP-binding protein